MSSCNLTNSLVKGHAKPKKLGNKNKKLIKVLCFCVLFKARRCFPINFTIDNNNELKDLFLELRTKWTWTMDGAFWSFEHTTFDIYGLLNSFILLADLGLMSYISFNGNKGLY